MFKQTVFFALLVTTLSGQTAQDMNMGLQVTDNGTAPTSFTISWWGKSGMHYLVETAPDLMSGWSFLPNYNPTGTDDVLGVVVETGADKLYFRVLQFDPNNVTGSIDGDGDGLPDDWESYYFGSISRDGTGDWNADGLLDRDAFRFGLDPKGEDESEVTGEFDSFFYDARGWLESMISTGGSSVSFSLDSEGNINSIN